MKKSEVIQTVQSSVSSIYSREDVIKIINMIDEVQGRVITVTEIGAAIENVMDTFDINYQDLVDRSSAEFDLTHSNAIELSSVFINMNYIRETLENTFMDLGEVDSE